MPGGEYEAVAVKPRGVLGVVAEAAVRAEEDGAHLSAAERETQVAGLGRRDRVHGQPTGLVGRL